LYKTVESAFPLSNGACKLWWMLTLNVLCAEMKASGRHFPPRTARDWWTKGLIPPPKRRGLGRGNGTETFWTDPRVSQQARAAFDLLEIRPRAEFALLGLWLLGFRVTLSPIRAIYDSLIDLHLQWVHGRDGQRADDVVGKLAEAFARRQANEKWVPAEARHAFTDLTIDALELFYSIDGESVSEGRAELWKRAVPYINGSGSHSSGLSNLHLRDEDLAMWAKHVTEMASLTAQRKAICSASDYELIRARRIVLLVFGYLRRFARVAECQSDLEDHLGLQLLIVFGRPAVPILIAVLRHDSYRRNIISLLLAFASAVPRPAQSPAQIRTDRR
jgi:hypothetical protein